MRRAIVIPNAARERLLRLAADLGEEGFFRKVEESLGRREPPAPSGEDHPGPATPPDGRAASDAAGAQPRDEDGVRGER